MSELSPEQLEQIVQVHVDALMEHFDAVEILASHVTEGGTGNVYRGAGNWYARTGMAADFLKRDEAETLVNRMPKPPPDNDDSESWKDS